MHYSQSYLGQCVCITVLYISVNEYLLASILIHLIFFYSSLTTTIEIQTKTTWVGNFIKQFESPIKVPEIRRGILAFLMGIISLIPLMISRSMFKDDPNSLNYGQARAWMFLSKITLPLYGYIVFPLMIITHKGKIYTAVKKELMESQFLNLKWFCQQNDPPHNVVD